jgi:hypothetical protein
MHANWARHGYQLVEKQRGWGTTGTGDPAGRFIPMTGMVPSQVPKMRALATRLRAQAHETAIGLYQRKLEILASELEEAAQEAESRAAFFSKLKIAS